MGQRLSGRRLRRLALAAAGAALAVALPVGAAMAPAGDAPSYRLTLTPDARTPDVEARLFTARLDRSVDDGRSWAGAEGQRLTFAFVGEGAVTVSSGSAGGLSCTTSPAGTCTVTVDSPGDSLLTATFEDLTATAPV